MDHPLLALVLQIGMAYLAVAALKCALMYGTLFAAVEAHHRGLVRKGYEPPHRIFLFAGVAISLMFIAVFHWPKALWNERWSFFSSYTSFSTMKDVLHGYR